LNAAIGCRDPEPPKYGWVLRESDGVWMGCNFSSHHWRLTCDGVRWIGQYETCSSGTPPLHTNISHSRLLGRIVQGGPRKRYANSWPQFCQILIDFQIFLTQRFFSKFEVKWLLNIQPHLAYVAILPCETLMPENKRLTINYKVGWMAR